MCLGRGRVSDADPRGDQNRSHLRAELLKLFGSPTQVGIENGYQAWTWLHVKAGGFGRPLSRELHVKFDERGIVKTYSYSSNLPEEVQQKTK